MIGSQEAAGASVSARVTGATGWGGGASRSAGANSGQLLLTSSSVRCSASCTSPSAGVVQPVGQLPQGADPPSPVYSLPKALVCVLEGAALIGASEIMPRSYCVYFPKVLHF